MRRIPRKPRKLRIPPVPKQDKTRRLPEHLQPRKVYEAPPEKAVTNPLVPAAWKEVTLSKRIAHWMITEGDRVQVAQGPCKGEIGTVVECFKKHNLVRIDGVNKKHIVIPDHLQPFLKDGEADSVEISEPLPYEDLRLVTRVKDESGNEQDVIVPELVRGPLIFNRERRRVEWSRWAPGRQFAIPWPKKPPQKFELGELDTPEADMLEETYSPSLHERPFASSILDELRNKYSKHRKQKEVRKRLLEEKGRVPEPLPETIDIDPNVVQRGEALKLLNRIARRDRRRRGFPIDEALLVELGKKMSELRAAE